MHVIGIDQSLTCTAVTIQTVNENYKRLCHPVHFFTTGTKKLVDTYSGAISPIYIDKKLTGFVKVYEICKWIDTLFPMSDGAVLAIEGYAMGVTKKTRSIFQLGELGGIIKWLAKENNMRVRTYSPSLVKQYATGKGAGKKTAMFEAYERAYPNSEILKYYTSGLNRKLPLEPQLGRTAGKPLCDLIDSHFISDMAIDELKIRSGQNVDLQHFIALAESSKKGVTPIIKTPYE